MWRNTRPPVPINVLIPPGATITLHSNGTPPNDHPLGHAASATARAKVIAPGAPLPSAPPLHLEQWKKTESHGDLEAGLAPRGTIPASPTSSNSRDKSRTQHAAASVIVGRSMSAGRRPSCRRLGQMRPPGPFLMTQQRLGCCLRLPPPPLPAQVASGRFHPPCPGLQCTLPHLPQVTVRRRGISCET